MSEDGIMICRALRPSTETWVSIKIPMHLSVNAEESVEYIIHEFNGEFIPMEFEWVDGLTEDKEK